MTLFGELVGSKIFLTAVMLISSLMTPQPGKEGAKQMTDCMYLLYSPLTSAADCSLK